MRRFVVLVAILALCSAGLLTAAPTRVEAGRFGPPWQARVVVDQAILYTQPDVASPEAARVSRADILVVTGQSTDERGQEWTTTTHGYVSSSAVAELYDSWVADVSVPSTPVYARGNAHDAIRLTAAQGQLLRVTGVSPGQGGDTHLWWSTTEGYVALDALQPSQNPWAASWTVPDGVLAINGWWGATVSEANVRAGPSTEAPSIGRFRGGQRVKVLVEGPGMPVHGDSTWYRIDGGRYAGGWIHSSLIKRIAQPSANTTPPPSGTPPSGRWIVVDRAHHSLTLVDNGSATFVTYVALGVAGRDTPAGTYSTWGKYRADDMTSASVRDPGVYYDLPNVPDTQYYLDGGYAIHGTYWHDEFGSDQSHGCVNVTWADGKHLFDETAPRVLDSQNTTPTGQPATPLVII